MNSDLSLSVIKTAQAGIRLRSSHDHTHVRSGSRVRFETGEDVEFVAEAVFGEVVHKRKYRPLKKEAKYS